MKTAKNTSKAKASRKLLKKLSAVRAVLPKDQRDVLDSLVLGEVKAHTMNRNPISQTKQVRQQVQGHALRSTKSARQVRQVRQQVQGHALRSTKSARQVRQVRQQVQGHALRSTKSARQVRQVRQQVQGHVIRSTKSARQAKKAKLPKALVQESAIPQIEFDPNLDEYRPVPE